MMATTKDYRDFILEQLSSLDQITYRPMMGEYLFYLNGILFGGIYDNRLLIKRTKGNAKFNLPEIIPYEHAKPMYQVEDLDNQETLAIMVDVTVNDLSR